MFFSTFILFGVFLLFHVVFFLMFLHFVSKCCSVMSFSYVLLFHVVSLMLFACCLKLLLFKVVFPIFSCGVFPNVLMFNVVFLC